ncbi:glycosyltransferase family 39 protein [Aestuariivirga litoralis]|uniref:glycosyltransferase family 39 protein n=1 Tax=Aestuariivirga litoralis TaxID=2650924 RepID=UPI0018C7E915|nr:hypothetical protein [Aestuariivirga litoralis]MBG1233482.1 hypothetical protein [Aestuariivirga litoralis]
MLAIGLLVFRDYGISWDEPQQRNIGAVSLKYVLSLIAPQAMTGDLQQLPDLQDFADRDYGVGFELPAFAAEKLLGLTSTQSIYFFRHLLNYLVFLIGVGATYSMAARRHGAWQAGLLAALLLYFSPRIFAESFYNDKDIIFMAAFALAACTMLALFRKPDFKSAFWHALATAWALDIRIMAIVMVPATLFVLAARAFQQRDLAARLSVLFTCWLAATFAFHVATFPFLWADPFGNFIAVFQHMAHFRWTGPELFLGEMIDGTRPPWHFALVWIGVTTPPLVLLLFAAGIFAVACNVLLKWTDETLEDITSLGLCVAPVLAVIVLHAIIYNGWRHLYFIYPFMILIAVRGAFIIWNRLRQHRMAAGAALVILASLFTVTGIWMWKTHPNQHVYFNALAGPGAGDRFEHDVWGLSNRAAVEYILAHDASPFISIAPMSNTPLENALLMLTDEQKRRIHVLRYADFTTYILNNYQIVPSRDDTAMLKTHDLYYQAQVDGDKLVSVFRRKMP